MIEKMSGKLLENLLSELSYWCCDLSRLNLISQTDIIQLPLFTGDVMYVTGATITGDVNIDYIDDAGCWCWICCWWWWKWYRQCQWFSCKPWLVSITFPIHKTKISITSWWYDFGYGYWYDDTGSDIDNTDADKPSSLGGRKTSHPRPTYWRKVGRRGN